jgi:hypothetical protein
MVTYVRTDGTIPMDEGYDPTRAQDVLTLAKMNELLGTAVTPGPFSLTASIDPTTGNAILNWTQSQYSTHYQVFADGTGGSDLGDVYDTDYDAGALTVDVSKRFYVRAWGTDSNNYRDTSEQTLLRVGVSGPTIVHHVAGDTAESGSEPSLTPYVGPALTFTRATPAMGLYHDSTWRRVTSGQPFFVNIARAENLFANSDAPATQTLTSLPCGQYRVEVWGTGSVALAGTVSSSGTVTESGGSVVFDHYAQNVDFDSVVATVTGTLTKFQITAGTESHQYIANGTVRYSYVASKRGHLRLIGSETNLAGFAYGAKGPTGFTNMALADRANSTSRSPWTARMYEFKEAATAGEHGLAASLTLSAGTHHLLIYPSADLDGNRSIGIGVRDSAGTRWAFINPVSGTVNATPTESSPGTTSYSCTKLPDNAYYISWSHSATQSINFRNFHVSGTGAVATSALSFTGATTNLTRSIGWFLKNGTPWMEPQLYADGVRNQEYGSYSLSAGAFDTTGATIRWRGLFVAGPAAANRTIAAGGNTTLRRNSSGKFELAVGAMTLTHPTAISDSVEASVAVRIKNADFAIAVDMASAGSVATSTTSATVDAVTTLYRGVDTALANPSHEQWSVFELHADAHNNTTLAAWTLDQGTGGTTPTVTQRFNPATHGGMYVRVSKQWSTQTKSGSVYSYGTTGLAQLQEIKTRNSNNGFANMAGVLLIFPWSAVQPTATTYTWTALDACIDWLETEGLSVFLTVQDRNFWRSGVTCPTFVTTRLDPTLAVYDSAALDLAATMEQKRVVVDAVANRYRNRSHFLGCIEPETALGTLNQLGSSAKQAHWANLISMRATLCAAFPELVFGNYVNGMNLVVANFNAQANASLSYGNCLWGWPDSTDQVLVDPVTNNYYYAYQIARSTTYNRKMVIFPGVQHDITGGGNYASYNTLLQHLIATEKAHCICMEPELTGYSTFWTDVVLRLASELTFNPDSPWTDVVET